jgi:hypothetical protein
VVGDPKTEAGRRTVSLSPTVASTLDDHLERFVPEDPDALVFGTSAGTFLHSANFGQTFRRAVDGSACRRSARTSCDTPARLWLLRPARAPPSSCGGWGTPRPPLR